MIAEDFKAMLLPIAMLVLSEEGEKKGYCVVDCMILSPFLLLAVVVPIQFWRQWHMLGRQGLNNGPWCISLCIICSTLHCTVYSTAYTTTMDGKVTQGPLLSAPKGDPFFACLSLLGPRHCSQGKTLQQQYRVCMRILHIASTSTAIKHSYLCDLIFFLSPRVILTEKKRILQIQCLTYARTYRIHLPSSTFG